MGNHREGSQRLPNVRLNCRRKATKIGGLRRVDDHPIVPGLNQPSDGGRNVPIVRHPINDLGTIRSAGHTDSGHLVLKGDNRVVESEVEPLNRDGDIDH